MAPQLTTRIDIGRHLETSDLGIVLNITGYLDTKVPVRVMFDTPTARRIAGDILEAADAIDALEAQADSKAQALIQQVMES